MSSNYYKKVFQEYIKNKCFNRDLCGSCRAFPPIGLNKCEFCNKSGCRDCRGKRKCCENVYYVERWCLICEKPILHFSLLKNFHDDCVSPQNSVDDDPIFKRKSPSAKDDDGSIDWKKSYEKIMTYRRCPPLICFVSHL